MRARKGERPGPRYFKLRRRVEPPRPSRRVLLIEDSRVDRLLVGTALALKGPPKLKLTAVADLDLALSLLWQQPYDLILLNDTLPACSPWEVARAVREAAPTTPVLRHARYLEEGTEDDDGLDVLVEAVCAALGQAGPAPIRPSSASGPSASASAAS